jgi:hypothetical protein
MAQKHPPRPRDANQLAKRILDLATGDAVDPAPEKSVPARSKGGKAGAKARAKVLTPERRKEIAGKAAAKRWNGPRT